MAFTICLITVDLITEILKIFAIINNYETNTLKTPKRILTTVRSNVSYLDVASVPWFKSSHRFALGLNISDLEGIYDFFNS